MVYLGVKNITREIITAAFGMNGLIKVIFFPNLFYKKSKTIYIFISRVYS